MPKNKLSVEQLEPREVLCVMPGVTPAIYAAMSAEVQHVLALVPTSGVTDEATRTGNWSDSSIWSAGHSPTNLDNVLIDSSVSVTINDTTAKAFTVRVDGQLAYSQTSDSLLTADTVVINAGGDYEQVVPNPNVHSGLTFSDSGPINRVWDPYGLSRQLIGIGLMDASGNMYSSATVNIQGAQKDGWESIGSVAAADTSINLPTAPKGWRLGDELLFNGTGQGSADESATITGINGNTVQFTPLAYNHQAPAGLQTTVADLTRNIVFQSANQSGDPQRNGGTMFMHTGGEDNDGITNQWGTPESVTIEYTSFDNLGRTDKSKPINDPVVVNGVLQAGTGTNPRARYAIHFHRDFNYDAGCAVQVTGNVVEGGPGWGYDNHSSNVDMRDNVAVGVYGAGFVTEAGNEAGSFVHNLAVHETSTLSGGPNEDGRKRIGDFGFSGLGFWFQGTFGFSVVGNVSVESPDAGYVYYGQSLNQGVIPSGIPNFINGVANVPQALQHSGIWTDTSQLPIGTFADNSTEVSANGMTAQWIGIGGFRQPVHNNIDNFTAWGISNYGIGIFYSLDLYITDPVLLAVANAGKNSAGESVNGGYTSTVDTTNADIEGFATGLFVPGKGIDGVHGGYFDNKTNINMLGADSTGHITSIDGHPQFGPNELNYLMQPTSNGNSTTDVANLDSARFRPNLVFINGQQVFYQSQAYDVNPFTLANFTQAQLDALPVGMKGMTNGQMEATFGFSLLGSSAPVDAVSLGSSNGLLIGVAQPTVPSWAVMPFNRPMWDAKTANSVFAPQAPDGTKFAPVTLQPGWNLIPEWHNGQLWSEWVYLS